MNYNISDTSAHEIGHQLLFEYGNGGYSGRGYSYSHKATSGPTWIEQDPLPGTKAVNDVLSLIWLTKIKVR